jgi:hypothetical protein
MATPEDSKLFREVESWLRQNPTKNIGDWKKETGYTGPNLKRRGRAGQLRVSFKGQSAAAQTVRATREAPKTEAERAYVNQMRAQARQQSQSTEAQYVSGGKSSIAEHNVRLASGGSSEYMSVSDPEFKQHKDNLEAIVQRQFGSQAVVDIDDVSGETRVIPTQVHNKFQPTSQQLGVDVPQGTDINQGIEKIRQLLKRVQKPSTSRFGAGSPMGIDLIGGPMTDIMPPSQEGYGPGGIIRTLPTAHERL